MRKKLLAIIATLAVVMTMIPTLAYADIAETDVAAIGETRYSSLKEAFQNANDGDTIRLLKDITLDQDATYDVPAKQNGNGKHHHYAAAVVNGKKDVTFNMNNHSIELNFDGNRIIGSIGGSSVILVQGNSSLTITGSGTMSATGTTAVIWAQAANSKITVENGTFKSDDDVIVAYADAGGEIYIEDGNFELNPERSPQYDIEVDSVKTQVLSTLVIDKRLQNKSEINCDGNASMIQVKGGTFTGVNPDGACLLTAGGLTWDAYDAVPEGYEAINNEDGTWTVQKVHKHEWTEDWKSDSKEHWNECSSCTEKQNVSAHYDNDNDSKCDKCGYDMTAKVPAGDKGNKNNTGTTADNSQVETGDNFNPVIFGGIALMAIIAMAAVVMTRRRHN